MNQATIARIANGASQKKTKRVRVRRTKSVEKFRQSALFLAFQEYSSHQQRIGHSKAEFPQSEEEIFNYVQEMKTKCKQFGSWDQYLNWMSQGLLKLYEGSEWIDQNHANTFFDSIAYVPSYIHLCVAQRSYDVELAQTFAMLIFGNLRTCVVAAEADAALQALYHVFLLDRGKESPRKSLFRATVILRIDNSLLTWPEAMKKANLEGQYIGNKTFERNFNAYLKGLDAELATLVNEWSNYPKRKG
jgi:hypothetical protein